jgi:hypothetical protein
MVAHAGVAVAALFVLPTLQVQIVEIEVAPSEHPRDTFVFSFYCRPPPAEPVSL